MADFTDQDQKTLETLRKAYESAGATQSSRDPWQELFSRDSEVEAARSVLAADIVKGFSGSWASSYNYGVGIQNEKTNPLSVASPVRATSTKLGLRGVPDVDFVPYNYRTNRFGSKGPSLVGHPISYEVLGPTLKSPACDWLWDVTLGAGPNGGDLLTIGTRYDGGAPTCASILQAYNLSPYTIGDPNEPNGGLYVLISDSGNGPGALNGGKAAIPRPDKINTARYELFRVASVRGLDIELHPNKSLGDFYTAGLGGFAVRAITLLQPYVTRLAAIPGSGAGVGREQSFVVVSPERAAQSDTYPPYDGGTPGDGTWIQGGFPNGEPTIGGDPLAYGGRNALPIPKARDEGQANLFRALNPASQLDAGTFQLVNSSVTGTDLQGKILSIFDVNFTDGAREEVATQMMGTYPITAVSGGSDDELTLQRVAEVSPLGGVPFFGPGPTIISPLALNYLDASFTIHDPVSDLWEGAFKIDDVEACRLTNLIDPRYVERLNKSVSDPAAGGNPSYAAGGVNAGRADRSIFNTATEDTGGVIRDAEDPGSLLDLGFRMVLFPAKEGPGGEPIPDFDNPIDSREVQIDATSTEAQYVEVDYSAGIVRLSVPPPSSSGGSPSSPSQIVPNGIITGSANDRGEVVLFASCVPYSMEEGQIGSGPRVTGSNPFRPNREFDVFSDEVFAYIDPNLTSIGAGLPGFGPSGVPGNPVAIVLDRIWSGPSTGVIEILAGSPDAETYGTWQYNSVETFDSTTAEGQIRSVSYLVGPQTRTSSTALTPPLGLNSSYLVRLRRQADTSASDPMDPRESADGVGYDTTYGASARPSSLRLSDFSPEYGLDGSIRLSLLRQAQRWQQWGGTTPTNRMEAVFNAGLGQVVMVQRWMRTDGTLAEPERYTEGGLTINEVVEPNARFDGQVFTFSPDSTGELRAMRFPSPVFLGAHEYRLVVKFEYAADEPLSEVIDFIGLLNPLSDPANPHLVGLASPPLLASDIYVGLRFEGNPHNTAAGWQFLVSDGTGNSTVSNLPHLNTDVPYYMVLETERDGYFDPDADITDPFTYRLKVQVLDQNLVPVFTNVVPGGAIALPQQLSALFMGSLATNTTDDIRLRIYYASLVTRKGLPGPAI